MREKHQQFPQRPRAMPANWTPADHAGLYGGDHATEAADNDTYTRPAPQHGSTEELAFNIFDRMDADGSGCLDKPEVTRLVDEVMGKLNLELLPEQHDKLINQSFKSADANSDGRLSRVEFEDFVGSLVGVASAMTAYGQTDESGPSPSAAMIAKRQGTMKDLSLFNVDGKAKSGLFRKFDENQDHRLDVGEAQKFLVSMLGSWGLTSDWVTPAWVREQFKRIDADGDAETVTADEFQARACQQRSPQASLPQSENSAGFDREPAHRSQAFCETIQNFVSALGPAVAGDGAMLDEGDAEGAGAGAGSADDDIVKPGRGPTGKSSACVIS